MAVVRDCRYIALREINNINIGTVNRNVSLASKYCAPMEGYRTAMKTELAKAMNPEISHSLIVSFLLSMNGTIKIKIRLKKVKSGLANVVIN